MDSDDIELIKLILLKDVRNINCLLAKNPNIDFDKQFNINRKNNDKEIKLFSIIKKRLRAEIMDFQFGETDKEFDINEFINISINEFITKIYDLGILRKDEFNILKAKQDKYIIKNWKCEFTERLKEKEENRTLDDIVPENNPFAKLFNSLAPDIRSSILVNYLGLFDDGRIKQRHERRLTPRQIYEAWKKEKEEKEELEKKRKRADSHEKCSNPKKKCSNPIPKKKPKTCRGGKNRNLSRKITQKRSKSSKRRSNKKIKKNKRSKRRRTIMTNRKR